MMTRTEAANNYKNAYKGYHARKGSTFNVEAAAEYAAQDVLSMVRHMSDSDAVYVINDETQLLGVS